MPYVPLSLDHISACLERIVDNREVFTVPGVQEVMYEYAAYRDTPAQPGALQVDACLACSAHLATDDAGVLCSPCTTLLTAAFHPLARPTDWLPRALAEHDILYLAAQSPKPVTAATLASRSRYTLRHMRQHLERLGQHGYLVQDVDLHTGLMTYALPAIVYPTALYQKNTAVLHTLSEARRSRWRFRQWRFRVPLAGLALGIAVFAAFALSPSWRPWAQSPRPIVVEKPPPLQRLPQTVPPHAIPVRVSMSQDGFTPIGMKLGTVQSPPFLLADRPLSGIVKEPAYQGERQKYGALRLGAHDNNVYYVVLDISPGRSPLLYVDRNQNGNLTDDGVPLANQGSGFFAATLRLPFARLVPHGRFPGTYEAWVFTNERLWQQGLMTYYSRTQLKGPVTIAGQTYTAYLADRGDNDADFTNDGLYIDLDGNDSINAETEYFPPGSMARIQNRTYVFEITW